ncbi:hypothetical protein BpHYR1_007130 [Brachionus plicatilis]|uniref:Uncharacterized protein n=1 Tax=Brachionus plicatilis TaxID=10195 RepID=A0A3M7QE84_BRAPC|nr:hypothetical protein BpHYR1_007130 [Brachionus plicatilis]
MLTLELNMEKSVLQLTNFERKKKSISNHHSLSLLSLLVSFLLSVQQLGRSILVLKLLSKIGSNTSSAPISYQRLKGLRSTVRNISIHR